jgi:ATP-dependent HslUV protease ATP-binding subunit HslU
VSELDKFIVGQTDAKKSVALALRNRMRRAKLETRLQSEVSPMNIMLIGSTGTGKTEISRRMAKLVDAPFVVAQATSFTEVGVVGPNTDSIIQDLVDAAIQLETTKQRKEVQSWARGEVEDILVDLLAGADASKELKQSIRTDLRANKVRLIID